MYQPRCRLLRSPAGNPLAAAGVPMPPAIAGMPPMPPPPPGFLTGWPAGGLLASTAPVALPAWFAFQQARLAGG